MLLVLIGHLHLSDGWLGIDVRVDTKRHLLGECGLRAHNPLAITCLIGTPT